MSSRFEWHDWKAETNLRLHGVSFDLAKTVFKDVFAVAREDDREDYGEPRFVSIGRAENGVILLVVTRSVPTASASSQQGGPLKLKKRTISGKTRTAPRPMTAEEIERAALADPDAQPLTRNDLKRMKRTPRAKIIRRALELSQEEFAARYHIPLGTLRDWEQGRATPDQATQAYLTLIAIDPEHIYRLLKRPLVGR